MELADFLNILTAVVVAVTGAVVAVAFNSEDDAAVVVFDDTLGNFSILDSCACIHNTKKKKKKDLESLYFVTCL